MIGHKIPRFVFGGVWGTAFVVLGESHRQIRGEPDVGFFWVGLASKKVDVVHVHLRFIISPPSLKLWRAAFAKATSVKPLACQP